MAGIGPLTQDWEPVVLRKKPLNSAAKKDEKAVNAARRSGAEIETVKKCQSFFSLLLLSPFFCFFLGESDFFQNFQKNKGFLYFQENPRNMIH